MGIYLFICLFFLLIINFLKTGKYFWAQDLPCLQTLNIAFEVSV